MLNKIRFCIVGSGPAGFYLTQNLLKFRDKFPMTVDIVEKAPVPFGLVRYGVAPDHSQVKNVIHTFTKIAEDKDVRFIGNIHIGQSIRLEELKKFYHVIVLAYGASTERRLNIPGEQTLKNVFSAKDFVGWYNGVPEYSQLNPDLNSTDRAVIIGTGNVALDCARILLSPIDRLSKTDITQSALEQLTKSRIRHVIIVGRRGPLQVSFTIKEFRELIQLKNVQTIFDRKDFSSIDSTTIEQLDRPRRRLTELMLKSIENKTVDADRFCSFKFWLKPKIIHGQNHVQSIEFETIDQQIPCGLLIKSIGYVGVQIDSWLPFDHENGIILSHQNRVHDRPGYYCTGWIGRGARGVIVDTTTESHAVARRIIDDLENRQIPNIDQDKSAFDGLVSLAKTRHVHLISYDDWKRLDQYEINSGLLHGKPREKILETKKMLELVSKSDQSS